MPEVETVRDLRRGQILRVAKSLVAEKGLTALTFAALEKRLHFSRGVITYHFRNKEELVDALLESAIEEIDGAIFNAVAAQGSIEEKFKAVMRTTVTGFLAHREAALILFSFWGQISSNDHLAKLNARLYQNYRMHSETLLKAGVEKGRFQTSKYKEIAALMVGIIIGIVTQVYFEPEAIDPEATIEEASRMLLTHL
jgi:AcrR family transcriptional regulator